MKMYLLLLLGVMSCFTFGTPSSAFSASHNHPPVGQVVNDTDPKKEQGCKAGCDDSHHPVAPLGLDEMRRLFGELNSSLKGNADVALETLLFHGPEVRAHLDDPALRGDRAGQLRRELKKTHARVWFRVVDDNGVVRARVDGGLAPIGDKTYYKVDDTVDLQPAKISGTVHRTGLHHLWTRM